MLRVVKVFYSETSGFRRFKSQKIHSLSVLRFTIQKQNYLLQGPQGDLVRFPGHQSSGTSQEKFTNDNEQGHDRAIPGSAVHSDNEASIHIRNYV